MMAAPATIPVVHGRVTATGQVVVYEDEAMQIQKATWAHYATNRPDMRQRYVSINHQSYRVLWRK